ncbi:MAG: helicase HerA-like domain-containing protein [Desulfobacterales bacterium]
MTRALASDMDDLRAVLNYIADNRKEISSTYGLISTPSIGAIQRALLSNRTAAGFFGEPALDLADLIRTDLTAGGIIHILAADQLILNPGCMPRFSSGCFPNSLRSCRKWVIRTNRAWYFSLTRPTFFLRTPRPP